MHQTLSPWAILSDPLQTDVTVDIIQKGPCFLALSYHTSDSEFLILFNFSQEFKSWIVTSKYEGHRGLLFSKLQSHRKILQCFPGIHYTPGFKEISITLETKYFFFFTVSKPLLWNPLWPSLLFEPPTFSHLLLFFSSVLVLCSFTCQDFPMGKCSIGRVHIFSWRSQR